MSDPKIAQYSQPLRIRRKAAAGAAVAVLMGSAAFAQSAAPTPGAMEAVFACQSKTDNMERLACFDAAISNLQQAESTGEIITVTREQVENVEKDSFGFNIPSLPRLSGLFGRGKSGSAAAEVNRDPLTRPVETPRPKREVETPFDGNNIKSIQLEIMRVKEFGYKKHRFYLANGQVWEQIDNTRVRVPKIKKNDKPLAYISRAALGSYLLKVDDKGQAIRVKRTR